MKTHGHTVNGKLSKTYQTWVNMRERCFNNKVDRYKNYGGRGISVCDRWANSFDNFLNDMGEKPNGMTIERIDVNANYSKENCRWATAQEQAKNKTNTRLISYNGLTLTTQEWAKKIGISFSCLRVRLHRNWPIEKALSK